MLPRYKFVLSLACALCLSSLGARAAVIEGEVFIRTNGGDVARLSLVPILLYDAQSMVDHLNEKIRVGDVIREGFRPIIEEAEQHHQHTTQESLRAKTTFIESVSETGDAFAVAKEIKRLSEVNQQKAFRYWQKLLAKAAYTQSALYYFLDPPAPVQATRTDAAGRFRFKAPAAAYVVSAVSSRQVGGETEYYYWMVRLKAEDHTNLMLANHNLSTSGSKDSLIQTPEDEDYIAEAMGNDDIETLATFVRDWRETREREEDLRQQEAEIKERQQKREMQMKEQRRRDAELEEFRRNPKAARRKAVQLYPELGTAGSRLNREFLALEKRYRVEQPDFFAEPDWPIRLAEECDEAFSTEPSATPDQAPDW